MKKRTKRQKENLRPEKKNIQSGAGNRDHLEPAEDYSVSDQERKYLEEAAEFTDWQEEEELKKAAPNNVDEDGEFLNEKTGYKDLGAPDLDIPDEFEDDPDEELGKSSEADPDSLHLIRPDEK